MSSYTQQDSIIVQLGCVILAAHRQAISDFLQCLMMTLLIAMVPLTIASAPVQGESRR